MNPIVEWLRRYRRLLGAAFLLALLAAGLWRVRAILSPFVLAGVLAYVLNPLLKLLIRKGFRRVAALGLIYLVVFLALAVAIGGLIPVVINELTRLAEFLPGYFAEVQRWALGLQERYSQVQLPPAVRQAIDDAVLSIQSQAIGMIARLAQSILGVFSAAFGLVLAPLLSFYLLKDLHGLRAGLRRVIPAQDRDASFRLLSDVDKVLSGFVRGQLTVALIVGSLVAVALTLLGIRFAVILGIFAGVTNIIPYFGPILGAIPILAVASASSTLDLLKAFVAVAVVQQLESQLISPRVIGRNVGLHPLAVVFALLAGFELYGILGMLLAVPIAGVIRVLVDYWVTSSEPRPAAALPDDLAAETAAASHRVGGNGAPETAAQQGSDGAMPGQPRRGQQPMP
jgi:predicted PurR-regulated permease PerM